MASRGVQLGTAALLPLPALQVHRLAHKTTRSATRHSLRHCLAPILELQVVILQWQDAVAACRQQASSLLHAYLMAVMGLQKSVSYFTYQPAQIKSRCECCGIPVLMV